MTKPSFRRPSIPLGQRPNEEEITEAGGFLPWAIIWLAFILPFIVAAAVAHHLSR